MGSISFLFFAYVGPEVALPVASVVASVVGFVMIVGRAPIRFAKNTARATWRGLRSIGKKADLRETRPPDAL